MPRIVPLLIVVERFVWTIENLILFFANSFVQKIRINSPRPSLKGVGVMRNAPGILDFFIFIVCAREELG